MTNFIFSPSSTSSSPIGTDDYSCLAHAWRLEIWPGCFSLWINMRVGMMFSLLLKLKACRMITATTMLIFTPTNSNVAVLAFCSFSLNIQPPLLYAININRVLIFIGRCLPLPCVKALKNQLMERNGHSSNSYLYWICVYNSRLKEVYQKPEILLCYWWADVNTISLPPFDISSQTLFPIMQFLSSKQM